MTTAEPRVLMANWTTRRAGGAERYLEQSLAALASRGVPVALASERDLPADRAPMALPAEVPAFVGREALDAAARWAPSLVVVHGVRDVGMLDALDALAPTAVVTHNYLGTCISGEKTHKRVTPRPCGRTLGWPCLLHYYPNHCGGYDPRTMVRLWRENRSALDRLRAARGVIALSPHMAREVERHDVPAARVHVVPPAIEPVPGPPPAAPAGGEPWRLLFVGRLDALKGASVLLDALPEASRALARPLELTVVGDGPAAAALAEQATALVARQPEIGVTWAGWVAGPGALADQLRRHHLLVMPSLWPEPFGLVGLEAGAAGLPTVAFDSGGIPDWLEDGVGGVLVRGVPRTAAALAAGIARALRDTGTWSRLAAGARAAAAAYSGDRFADTLLSAVVALHAGR